MRAMIVFNPAAGSARAFRGELDAAADLWRDRGWQVELEPTAGPGDATRLARRAAERDYDLVAAAGGDGTINEVVNGLALSTTALATLPLGTMNVWARELKLPLTPRAAAARLLHSQVRSCDLGRAGGRYFLLMAGIGFDAAIAARILPEAKRRFGALAYIAEGLQLALKISGTRVRLSVDDRVISGSMLLVVIGNTRLYGGLVRITDTARIDDGLLDVRIFKGDHFTAALRHTASIVLGRYDPADPDTAHYRGRRVEVTASPPLPVQLDGDTAGMTPMVFEVMPRALRVLLPERLPECFST